MKYKITAETIVNMDNTPVAATGEFSDWRRVEGYDDAYLRTKIERVESEEDHPTLF